MFGRDGALKRLATTAAFVLLAAAVGIGVTVLGARWAWAQVGPTNLTYVRPARGNVATIANAQTMNGSLSVTSVTFKFSGYAGANIEITNATASFKTCDQLATVTLQESTDGSTWSTVSQRNAIYIASGNGTVANYFVPVGATYGRFVTTDTAGPGATSNCVVTVKMTPAATATDFAGSTYVASGSSNNLATSGICISLSVTVRELTFQNQGTVPLVFAFDSVPASATAGAFALSASAVAWDGSGGSWTTKDFGGTICLRPASGTGAYSYYVKYN